MKIKFEAKGRDVFRILDGNRVWFCTINKEIIAPNSAAQETADALNEKFNR